MTSQKVVIIIPTYNEALVIEETLQSVFAETKPIPYRDIHVLVFDSASTDNTQAIVKALQKDKKNPKKKLFYFIYTPQ